MWAKVGETNTPKREFKFWWKIAIKMHDVVNLFFERSISLSPSPSCTFQKLTFLFSENKLQSNTLCNNGVDHGIRFKYSFFGCIRYFFVTVAHSIAYCVCMCIVHCAYESISITETKRCMWVFLSSFFFKCLHAWNYVGEMFIVLIVCIHLGWFFLSSFLIAC